MARTSSAAVQLILGQNYDGSSDLSGFLLTAGAMVDVLAARDTAGVLNATLLERIEAFLTAHYYAHSDQLKQGESVGRASVQYQGQTAMGFRSTQYGQSALELDISGELSALGKKQPKMMWLGKTDSEAQSYEDRN
jgi:hypothetical protein